MKITFLKNKSKKLGGFLKREWKLVHPEHFGVEYDSDYWENKKIKIRAEEKGEIAGALNGHLMAGVLYISELIIAHDKRGRGIGKTLMDYTEDFAKKNKGHLIYLETGADWKAVKFYENLGFKKITLLKNFYDNRDFWLMAKSL